MIAQDQVHPYAAITDYLNTTFKFDPANESFANLFQELFALLGEKFAPAVERAFGKYNYKKSYELGSSTALLCIGGQAGTVLVSMPGSACSLVSDWASVVEYFAHIRNGRITRWDGAVDEYVGLHSVNWAADQYLAGNFQCGGNKPRCENQGNWTDPDGTGRTFKVGQRTNGKMIRIYEKGQQLGCPWHPWVRWEVELHNVDRVVPWEVLIEPGRYVVGSYPKVLSWVQEEMTPIRTIRKQQQIGYDHLTATLKNAYGPMLNVMRQVEGSAEAVLKKLVRPGAPRRLRHPAVDKPGDFIE